MSPILQFLLAIGLAASCGLRAWLPLLAVGLAARFQWLSLHESFLFLARMDILAVLVIATVIELLADKIPAIDNLLDSISFFLRPVAGAVLASSLMIPSDPGIAGILGVIFGGGAALSVHSAKALVRAKSTATAFAHGGLGNTTLSIAEDLIVGVLVLLTVWFPWLALAAAFILLAGAIGIIYLAVKAGKRIFRLFRRGEASPDS